MVKGRSGISIRVPNSILAKIDQAIEAGEYSDQTDFFIQAALYQLFKAELRAELKTAILQDLLKEIGHLDSTRSDRHKRGI